MSRSSDSIRIGPSLLRRCWLRITAWAGDHPRLSVLGIVVFIAAVLFYGIRLNGFAHLAEALSRWRMEVFGGTYRVERSIEVPEVILSFREQNYDRVDALTGSAAFMGGSAFRQEIHNIVQARHGSLRIVALDPRLGDRNHPNHPEFVALAQAFGCMPWEYTARCRHSIAVLMHLKNDFPTGLEVRLLDAPLPSAAAPFFTPGRAVQLYRNDEPSTRLDIIVPRPAEADGLDSFAHPGLIIRNRPDDAEVKRFKTAFEEAWTRARPMDSMASEEILRTITSVPP